MKELTQERLKEVLDYDPETGVFTWRQHQKSKKIKVGSIAGSISLDYRVIGIDGQKHRAHRLAWLYIYGKWPGKNLDHINRIKSDNRLANLREATTAENQRNVGIGKKNKSGFKGVFWEPERKKWKARAQFNNKKYTLGRFNNIEDAIEAYENFCKQNYAEFYVPQTELASNNVEIC